MAGLFRALDLAANEYQGGADGSRAWNPETGQYLPDFPAQVNDLSVPHRPVGGRRGRRAGEEILAGTASMDLQAFNAAGAPASDRWPRLHGDWMVATPRSGRSAAGDRPPTPRRWWWRSPGAARCSPTTPRPRLLRASSPRFHHDNHNSGDFERDAVAPGKPEDVSLEGSTLSFTAPGDDLLCGTADRYELVHSDSPDRRREHRLRRAAGRRARAGEAGTEQSAACPRGEALRGAARARRAGQPRAHRSVDRGAPAGGGPGGGGRVAAVGLEAHRASRRGPGRRAPGGRGRAGPASRAARV